MSEEYANTRQDFLTATASYLGLDPDAISPYSELKTDDDWMVAVLYVRLKPSDIIGIGKRMQEIAAQNNDVVQVQTDTVAIEGPTVEAMREAYNALTKAEKGRYGSFARYMAESSGGIVAEGPAFIVTPGYIAPTERTVTHVDTPEEPEPTNMGAVWLDGPECTDAQRQFGSDTSYCHDTKRTRYLVQWAMLTDEQKQKAKL